MVRRLRYVLAGGLVLATVAMPRVASADTIFTIGGGWFSPKAEDARVDGDVIVQNLNFLWFDPEDFDGGTVNGDLMFGLGRFAEVGVGAGYYQRTVPSVYARSVHGDGTEIYQELKLRTAPMTATVRLFPAGRFGGFQPYVGGGIAVVYWRYSETGEWVDDTDDSIFRESYVDSGYAVGPVVFGGLRLPVSDAILLGGEFRYQDAEGDLDPSLGFAGNKIDVGGYSVTFTFGLRF